MGWREVKRAVLHINSVVLIVAIIGLGVAFSLLSRHFLTLTNLRVILETMSILTILSLGVHSLLVAGEIDISFAAVLGLSAVVAALVSSGNTNTFLLILSGLAAAVAVGLANGFFVVNMGIPSFLVTLASMAGVNGLVLLLSNYRSVLLSDDLFPEIFYGRPFWQVPTAVFWMVGLIIVTGIVLRYTRFGRWVYATGGNNRVALLMGIPTKRVRYALFVASSFLAGIAGFIVASRSLSARPLIGDAYLMPAIAAPILGGALLTGGRGSVIRTTLGALVLTIITNGANLLGLEPAYQNIFMAIILIGSLSTQGGRDLIRRLLAHAVARRTKGAP